METQSPMPKHAQDRDRQIVLEILNQHVDSAPDLELDLRDYVSYFQNELGEQWIFIRREGDDHGMLYGGDIGWEGHEIRNRTKDAMRAAVRKQGVRESMIDKVMAFSNADPLAPNLVLQDAERTWLNTIWWTSSKLMGGTRDQSTEMTALAEAVVDQTPIDGLADHPNSTNYKVATQTLAMVVGQAAGMRGMSTKGTLTLFQEATRIANERTDGD